MRFPANPGWAPLPVAVGVPRHSWLRAPGAVPRHSWLGSTGGGGVWSLATPGCGSWLRFPATPGWSLPAVAVAVSVGFGGRFPVVCVFVVWRVRAGCLCSRVCRVFVVVAWVWVCLPCVGVRVCVCVCGVWRLVAPAGACRWCGCGLAWCVSWLVPRHSWGRLLGAIPRHSWLHFAADGGGCSSPLLAEGHGCGSLPLLAGVRWRRRCVVASHSWLRVLVAVPRHSWQGSPLAAVVGGPLPLLAEGLGCGSPPLLAGVRRLRRWVFRWVGVSGVVCARGAACACGVCAGVCGVCLWCLCWWWCGCGCAFRVRLCVCVCACVVCWWRVVAGPCFLRLLLVSVGVWLVCAVVGPSPLLAEVPVCDSS